MTDLTMTCAGLDDRLADYLDDALRPAQRAAVERHLATCARCAGVLAALDERPRAAAALPVLALSRDLWSGVVERITSRVLPLSERAARRSLPPRWRAAGLAAAAALLVTGTALITRQLTVNAPARDVATTRAPAASDGPQKFASAVETYDSEIAHLDSIVRLRRGDLDSATIAVVERNLRVINRAIAESRAAVAKDPRSRFLHDQLANVLDKKVVLLRTVALLPNRT